MRKVLIGLAAAAIFLTSAPAFAQDSPGDGTGEIVVTGSLIRKRNTDDQLRPVPIPAAVQMLRRTADFAIQQVVIASDTVDEDEARKEVVAMVRKAIDLAGSSGVLVASGEIVVEPLTATNYTGLKILDSDDDDNEDDRNNDIDGQYVKFLIKVPLAPGIDAKTALAKIDQFIKKVPQVGRAEMKAYSELTLSVVNPEQYRGAIIDLIAKDTAATSAKFGAGYGVEVTGLDKPVQWKRAGLTELQLYLPSNSTMRPRN
jgi:hypothetical protein